MIKKNILLLCATSAVLAGCVAAPRFEYGSYEPALYAYYKKPEMADKFEAALQKAIKKGEETDRLAPGMYAELGYLKLSQGDQAGAVELFRKEAQAFPESEVFMSGVVTRLNHQESEDVIEEEETDSNDVKVSENAIDGMRSAEGADV